MSTATHPSTPLPVGHGIARALAAVGLAFAVLLAAGAAAENDDDAGTGPAAVLERFHAALSEGDRATVEALTSPDLLIYEGGGAERSFGEYASHHLGADMEFAAAMSDTIVNQDIHIVGDTAWAVTESRSTGTWDGRTLKLRMTETAILERDDGAWRIVHFHWSSRPVEEDE